MYETDVRPGPHMTSGKEGSARAERIGGVIEDLTNRLSAELDEQENALAQLRDRIRPILGPPVPVEEDISKQIPEESDLAGVLRSYWRQITSITSQIHELSERCEL